MGLWIYVQVDSRGGDRNSSRSRNSITLAAALRRQCDCYSSQLYYYIHPINIRSLSTCGATADVQEEHQGKLKGHDIAFIDQADACAYSNIQTYLIRTK